MKPLISSLINKGFIYKSSHDSHCSSSNELVSDLIIFRNNRSPLASDILRPSHCLCCLCETLFSVLPDIIVNNHGSILGELESWELSHKGAPLSARDRQALWCAAVSWHQHHYHDTGGGWLNTGKCWEGGRKKYIDGLEQDCSNSIGNALELLQSCATPSIWWRCCYSIMIFPKSSHLTTHSSPVCMRYGLSLRMLWDVSDHVHIIAIILQWDDQRLVDSEKKVACMTLKSPW